MKLDYHPMPVQAKTLPEHQCECEGCNIPETAYVYCALCDTWWCAFHFAAFHYPPPVDRRGTLGFIQIWGQVHHDA